MDFATNPRASDTDDDSPPPPVFDTSRDSHVPVVQTGVMTAGVKAGAPASKDGVVRSNV